MHQSTTTRRTLISFALMGMAMGSIAAFVHAEPADKPSPIYDTEADGGQQIAQALKIAGRENKRVLLQFGANWCVWCHQLHELFEQDKAVAKKLANEYELVLIDVDMVGDERHNDTIDKRYGRPTRHGLPVLVVLDVAGRQLTTQETESWEVGDHHDPAKVLGFLTKWQAKQASAQEALSTALSRAQWQGKNVFAYFSAPWCGYCKKMSHFLFDDEKSASLMNAAYVPVKIDVERMSGGKELADKRGMRKEDGLPFFVILDASGKRLADSRGPQGNVGFPVEPFEIEHFMKIIRQTAKKLSADQFATIESALR